MRIKKMTPRTLAERLNGMAYRSEIPTHIIRDAKANGLVIIIGVRITMKSDQAMAALPMLTQKVLCLPSKALIRNQKTNYGNISNGKAIVKVLQPILTPTAIFGHIAQKYPMQHLMSWKTAKNIVKPWFFQY